MKLITEIKNRIMIKCCLRASINANVFGQQKNKDGTNTYLWLWRKRHVSRLWICSVCVMHILCILHSLLPCCIFYCSVMSVVHVITPYKCIPLCTCFGNAGVKRKKKRKSNVGVEGLNLLTIHNFYYEDTNTFTYLHTNTFCFVYNKI